jgi:transcriptional regulator with XRE-family HTH domain
MRDSQKRQRLAHALGAAAREARLQRGLTQGEVADRVGIAMEVYGRIERGRLLPSIRTFLGMCRVLEADARVLLGLVEPGSASAPEQTPEEPPHLRRLMRLARELREEEVVALQGVAKVMLEGRRERRKG